MCYIYISLRRVTTKLKIVRVTGHKTPESNSTDLFIFGTKKARKENAARVNPIIPTEDIKVLEPRTPPLDVLNT